MQDGVSLTEEIDEIHAVGNPDAHEKTDYEADEELMLRRDQSKKLIFLTVQDQGAQIHLS